MSYTYLYKEQFKGDPFWTIEPSILYTNGNYYRILPTSSMTKIESLNALTRFFIYLLILFFLFGSNHDSKAIYIPIVGIIVIIMIYYLIILDSNDNNENYQSFNDIENYNENKSCQENGIRSNPNQSCLNDDLEIKSCQMPTKDNPFMNVAISDYNNNPTRGPACNDDNVEIKELIDKNFYYNLLQDQDDLYGRGYSARQFHSMPSTTIPNDQTGFARWLYYLPQTCKEDNANCLKYEDVRYVRFNPNIDYPDKVIPDPAY
jgi:hypothetical protein